MGRSNTGGTRGFLRGKVANDLYQVTKTATGKKVQLVRSVEETRINNNTLMQAVARMQMALCMGCLKQFKEIVDHSWQGIPYGQLSIANFVKVNIPLLQEDCRSNWEADNRFSYPEKGVARLRVGEFKLASGTLVVPDSLSIGSYPGGLYLSTLIIDLGMNNPTMADLKAVLGLNAKDYITGLTVYSSGRNDSRAKFVYRRAYLSDAADSMPINYDTVASCFEMEGNTDGDILYNATYHRIYIIINDPDYRGRRPNILNTLIVSRWNGEVWCRNNAQLKLNQEFDLYDYVAPANSVFDTWFNGYDPDQPYNPYDR